MVSDPKSWRSCYLHPNKAAIRECISCNKPICGRCAVESGDPLLCPPCSKTQKKEEVDLSAPLIKKDFEPGTPLDVGEVTVFDDGRVVEPEPAAPAATPPPADKSGEKEAEKKVIAVESVVPPAGVKEKAAKPPGRRPIPQQVKAAREKPAARREPKEKRKKKERKKPRISAKWAMNLNMLKRALPYSLITGVCVCGFWLILALILRKWTQLAILSLGIVVPWSLVKGYTVKRVFPAPMGGRPPPPALTGFVSLIVTALFFVPVEFLAFKIIFRGSDFRDPFSEFTSAYFGPLGILLVVLAFAFALGIPLLLSAGERWHSPTLRKGKKNKTPG